MIWSTLLGWGRAALGFAGGIKIWLIVGGIVSALVLFLWMETSRLAAQRDKARMEAADAKIAIEAIRADNELAMLLVKARDAKIAELENRTNALIQRIRAVPVTRACSSSPSMRVLLDGLHGSGAGKAR